MTGSVGLGSSTIRLLPGLLAGLLLAACGAGGEERDLNRLVKGGSQANFGLEVVVPALPAAARDEPMSAVRLTVADESTAAIRWSLWEGSLPRGIQLDSDGWLRGTPRTRGVHVFSVQASDGLRAGLATVALAVDELGVFPCAGLTAGDAWAGRPVILSAAGGEGGIAWHILENASGGSFLSQDEDGLRAVWLPGHTGGTGAIDQLEVRDPATGRTASISFAVRADPTASHVAEFGSSDVWHIQWYAKRGNHPFASDFHAALARVGFRGAESTSRIGRPIDELVDLWLRLETLRSLNRMFLRDPDGSAGAQGLPISFPLHEPGPGYGRPPAGGASHGGALRYSEISVLAGDRKTILGTALADDAHNRLHENDTTVPGSELGAFVNVLAEYFDAAYDPLALRRAPLRASDADAVKALLYGGPSTGVRYTILREYGRRFALLLAVVLAHEIGHSLGLPHLSVEGVDAIMSPQAPIAPWHDPVFAPAHIQALRTRLPGPGRYQLDGLEDSAAGEGAHVCAGRACHLRLPRARIKRVRRPGVDAPAPR